MPTIQVSPQLHVKHDPSFDVVKQDSSKSSKQDKPRCMTKKEQQTGSKRNILASTNNDKLICRFSSNQISKKKLSVTFADPSNI